MTRRCPDPEPDLVAACIYKPVMGERPLDDFPDATLARREVAAFAVSQASGWGIVPPTVLRDGPFGEGMVQLWIRVDRRSTRSRWSWTRTSACGRSPCSTRRSTTPTARRATCCPVPGGHVYGVDHGVTFSPVPKLRTVLWGWRGQPMREDELEALRTLRACLDDDARRAAAEPAGARSRCRPRSGGSTGCSTPALFPQPDPRRPALPWPPV